MGDLSVPAHHRDTARHSRKAGGTGSRSDLPLGSLIPTRAERNSRLRGRPDQVAGRYRSPYRTAGIAAVPRCVSVVSGVAANRPLAEERDVDSLFPSHSVVLFEPLY